MEVKFNRSIEFSTNEKVYILKRTDGNNGCSRCAFLKDGSNGYNCNEAKSQPISCYAGSGRYYWEEI